MDLTNYDDTPYRERSGVAPVYTVSVDLEPVNGYVYVYVDGADERLARQRFAAGAFETDVETYNPVRWVNEVLTALIKDPEGRNACGDCGNWTLNPDAHAPDCRWSRWSQRRA